MKTYSQWKRPNAMNYLRHIVESRVYDIAIETPLMRAPSLEKKMNHPHPIWFKREDMQTTFSFNVRGAYNKMAHLTPEQRAQGVISSSAGNHAQGVAASAAKLNIPATIVFPVGTEAWTLAQVTQSGARVMQHGLDFHEAAMEAKRVAREEGLILVHPFDDPLVIAGQGTIALELMKQLSSSTWNDRAVENVSTTSTGKPEQLIFVPVGGGGLLAGMVAFFQSMAPSTIRVIGVEAENANVMQQSLEAQERVRLSNVNCFVDQFAVKQVGQEPFCILTSSSSQTPVEIITVSTDEICAAMKDIFEDTRSLVEPLGAMSVAGLKKYLRESPPEHCQSALTAVLSCANMDFDRLRFISERCDDREKFMAVTIPETRGSFQRLYRLLYPRNVTEFSYRMTRQTHAQAHICLSVQTLTEPDFETILSTINSRSDMTAMSLNSNEMAKSHVRHLVGGRCAEVLDHERLFRLEFPERPGALHQFLQALEDTPWNISLFHYRNHGSDVGRVLVAFQVKPVDNDMFHQFLQDLGFSFTEETLNPIYTEFLK